MSADYLVIGYFKFVDDTKQAIVRLKEQGHSQYWVYSPVPSHDLDEEIYRGKLRSPVRLFTLTGAIVGCLGAFLMTCWMSMDWPLRVSAKPIISIPAFVIIGFECTVLFGCLCTLLGMLHFCKIPNIFACPGYRADFSKDIFGLVTRVSKDEAEKVKQGFVSCGAGNVEIEYVR